MAKQPKKNSPKKMQFIFEQMAKAMVTPKLKKTGKMTPHYTTKEGVKEAINNVTGKIEIVMLNHLHNHELEAIARAKANSLNLDLSIVHWAQVFPEPDFMRYQFSEKC